MNYIEYIELGFERTEMNDSVEFKQTGFYGYALEKIISPKIRICVSSGELDQPKMYIKKSTGETNHIFKITPECVIDLCKTE